MNTNKNLIKLGLSSSEAKVYTTLLKLGGGYVSSIAKHSDVERTNCYHTLKTLNKKGLISITNRGNYQYYLPETPKKFLHEQEEKLHVARNVVPELLALQEATVGLAPKMKYYEGKEAVLNLLKKSLESKTEILRYTNLELFIKKFEEDLTEFTKEKEKRNIKSRIISPYHTDAEDYLSTYYSQKYIDTTIQLLFINPKEFFLENDVIIFDDKVTIISLNPGENMGIMIESKVYADTSRTTFNLSWLGATSFIAK
jgi:sugar-specific transcriptional regulator TrmB